MNARRQQGLALVETAIVGVVAMLVLFGVLEVSRAMFVMNALEEATRRGARVATVCQVNDPAISQIAVFSASGDGGGSDLVYGLTSANIDLSYLNATGSEVADVAGDYLSIRYVRVGIVNYQHRLLIPFFVSTINMPRFDTTLPRESLGVGPDGLTTC